MLRAVRKFFARVTGLHGLVSGKYRDSARTKGEAAPSRRDGEAEEKEGVRRPGPIELVGSAEDGGGPGSTRRATSSIASDDLVVDFSYEEQTPASRAASPPTTTTTTTARAASPEPREPVGSPSSLPRVLNEMSEADPLRASFKLAASRLGLSKPRFVPETVVEDEPEAAPPVEETEPAEAEVEEGAAKDCSGGRRAEAAPAIAPPQEGLEDSDEDDDEEDEPEAFEAALSRLSAFRTRKKADPEPSEAVEPAAPPTTMTREPAVEARASPAVEARASSTPRTTREPSCGAETVGLEAPAEVEEERGDAVGIKALLRAVQENDVEAVGGLLKEMDINSRDPKDGYSALFVAAEEGHTDLAAWLVRKGAKVEAVDADGRTPLFAAAVANRPEVVDYLIREAGASSDVSNAAGRHVFWACCALDLVDVAAVLLDASAARGRKRIDINAKDPCGLSALDFAKRMNHHQTAAFLKHRGALDSRVKGQVSRLARDWEIRELDAIISSS